MRQKVGDAHQLAEHILDAAALGRFSPLEEAASARLPHNPLLPGDGMDHPHGMVGQQAFQLATHGRKVPRLNLDQHLAPHDVDDEVIHLHLELISRPCVPALQGRVQRFFAQRADVRRGRVIRHGATALFRRGRRSRQRRGNDTNTTPTTTNAIPNNCQVSKRSPSAK